MTQPTYCKSCGAYIPDGKKKCLACGFPVDVPSLMAKEGKEWIKSNMHLFKPIESLTEQRLFEYKGYTVDDYGNVLSVPEDVFESYMKEELF